MFGYGYTGPDREVRISPGVHHIPMVRFYQLKGESGKVPFDLCHKEGDCGGIVRYNHNDKDPPMSEWKCSGCTSPGGLLFRDWDLKTLSLVRLKQLIYVRRQWKSTDEKTLMLDYDGRKGHGHHFAREMTKQEENDYHVRILERALQRYLRERP